MKNQKEVMVVIIQQSYKIGSCTNEMAKWFIENWVSPEATLLFCKIETEKILDHIREDKKIPVYHSTHGILDHIQASNLLTFEFVEKSTSALKDMIDNILADVEIVSEECVEIYGRNEDDLNFVKEEFAEDCAANRKALTFGILWERELKKALMEKHNDYPTKAIFHVHSV